MKVFIFPNFLEILLKKKIPFYGAQGFLTSSSVDSWKSDSKIPKPPLSTAIWSWYSRKFSKIKVFVFPNFLKILLKKNFNFMARRPSWHVSLSIPENRTQKHLKLTSPQHVEVDISGNFQKRKFLFFPIFWKFCLKKIPFYGTLNFLICFSVDPRKLHLNSCLTVQGGHIEHLLWISNHF